MRRIVVDWGSSSFRAYLIDDAGRPICARANQSGVLDHNRSDNSGDFKTTLMQHCGDWLQRWPGTPIILCGMIGSRSGWLETPYLDCPLDARTLGENLQPLSELNNVCIVPGVQCLAPSGVPDVMRGEETQVFGALRMANRGSALVLLPGTHSKWVQVQNGQIKTFATFFTGELFALLHKHSSIGLVIEDAECDEQSFCEGLTHSDGIGGPLHQIFSIRAKSLCENHRAGSLSSFLSGILIGNEFSEALKLFPQTDSIVLVGDAKLQRLYQLAARHFGCALQSIDPALAVIRGVEALCGAARDTQARRAQC
jgi:2-dehydro-3-deoxygalactonokinase